MLWKKRIYLDFAAGREASPSSPHTEGRKMKKRLEDSREKVARLVECKSDEVVFTSGATEANALAILGLAKPGAHMLYLPSAHASIIENMKLAQEQGVETESLKIKNGEVDIVALKAQLRPETALVSMEAVCGETGAIWNTREVALALERSRHAPSEGLNWPSGRSAPSRVHAGRAVRALLHIDASQAPFTEKLMRSHFSADLLTLDGNKLGARGTGALIAHRTIPLAPLYGGGGQERGLRAGTENVQVIEKLANELERVAQDREGFKARAAERRARLIAAISGVKGLYINEGRQNVPHILNISLPGRDTDYLVALLDEAGFAVSTKSACEAGDGGGSRAVLALYGDPVRAASTLRISFGPAISGHDLARFAKALSATCVFIDSTAGGAHD
jgi:cysteine desulfurase